MTGILTWWNLGFDWFNEKIVDNLGLIESDKFWELSKANTLLGVVKNVVTSL